jgi:Raf kinase inhibitor-like YbhB/YbcL family protein
MWVLGGRGRPAILAAVLVAVVIGAACGSSSSKTGRKASTTTAATTESPMPMTLTSALFTDGDTIPTRSTCDGQSLSPPLAWTGQPAGTAGFALTMEDPDAPSGTFVHWVLWGLPASVHELDEGVVPTFAHEGVNGAGKPGYTGPCPPKGNGPHRYIFTLYALSRAVSVPDGATIAQLRSAMDGAVVAEGRLTGRYAR